LQRQFLTIDGFKSLCWFMGTFIFSIKALLLLCIVVGIVWIEIQLQFYFFSVLRIELRAFHLLDKCSTIWANVPLLASNWDLPISACQVSLIRGIYHHASFNWLIYFWIVALVRVCYFLYFLMATVNVGVWIIGWEENDWPLYILSSLILSM
jgi:hypothetical protein